MTNPIDHCKCVHPAISLLIIHFMLCLFILCFVCLMLLRALVKNHKYRSSALTSQSMILWRQQIHVCEPQAIEGYELRRSVGNNFTLPGRTRQSTPVAEVPGCSRAELTLTQAGLKGRSIKFA